MVNIFWNYSFVEVTWFNGGRHHVNPSFSRDGMRLYYNKASNICELSTGAIEVVLDYAERLPTTVSAIAKATPPSSSGAFLAKSS